MHGILVMKSSSQYIITNEKSAQRRRKHCALAVVRRSQKCSPRRRPPSLGRRDGQNLINWRLSLYLYLQTQFGEDRCTQFRVIVVTEPQTNKQSGPITIHCAAYSAQCNYVGWLIETTGVVTFYFVKKTFNRSDSQRLRSTTTIVAVRRAPTQKGAFSIYGPRLGLAIVLLCRGTGAPLRRTQAPPGPFEIF